MSRINLLTIRALALVLIFLLPACAEEPLDDGDKTGGGYTITLRLSATIDLIPETKLTVVPVRSGSDAKATGFYYEMVSSDAVPPSFNVDMETTRPDSATISLSTKAPGTLKNVYALLFTREGAFNGRANIGAFTVGTAAYIDFKDVKTTTATGCRLVVVANDNDAATSHASSTNFASFSGSYADFQKLTIISAINQDTDVPYAGSATIEQSLSESGVNANVPLCRTLAKITMNNIKFYITGGPARSSITLYNAGVRRFATQGNDNYDGTGSTQTSAFIPSTAGSNAASVTWCVGENIQPAGTSIISSADRNTAKAPKNACYIRIAATQSEAGTIPKVGDEYIAPKGKSFTYDFYLGNSSVVTDFALRRHTNYTITFTVSGTLVAQEELAAIDGRVTFTKTGGEKSGLAIGMLGGTSGYTPGTGAASTISGSYTKMLLLQPNTSGSTAEDTKKKPWGYYGDVLQPENCKYWDPTYTSVHIDQIAGRSSDYCYNLTIGNVSKGTWYLPTQAQLMAIWFVFKSLQGNSSFANYTAFDRVEYWSSTEYNTDTAWCMYFGFGDTYNFDKMEDVYNVRCVREA